MALAPIQNSALASDEKLDPMSFELAPKQKRNREEESLTETNKVRKVAAKPTSPISSNNNSPKTPISPEKAPLRLKLMNDETNKQMPLRDLLTKSKFLQKASSNYMQLFSRDAHLVKQTEESLEKSRAYKERAVAYHELSCMADEALEELVPQIGSQFYF
jgi:hypothetical protein